MNRDTARRIGLTGFALLLIGSFIGLTSHSVQADHIPYATGDVFAGVGGGQIDRYSPTGVFIESLNTLSGSAEETGMCFDAAGNLYTTNWTAGIMSKFDNKGGLLVHPWGGPFHARPESCVVDSAGNIYVGEVDGDFVHIHKFDAAGILLATFTPAFQSRGIDWMDLAADQRTMFYTSEGTAVKRFDVSDNVQLSDFATGLPAPCYALRIRANGEALVACASAVQRLSSTGTVLKTYSRESVGESSFFFALNLDPDGTSFWTAGYFTGNVYKFDISTGNLLFSFNALHTFSVAGLAIFKEPTVALPHTTETLQGGGTARPGDPLWVTATFDSAVPVIVFRPDCFNTSFTATGPDENPLPSKSRHRGPYGIPNDVDLNGITHWSVTCDLFEIFHPQVLTSGPSGSQSYPVQATYSHSAQDPVCANPFQFPGDTCINLTIVTVTSNTITVTISGTPVQRRTARVSFFDPGVWPTQCPSFTTPTVSARISDIAGHNVSDVKLDSIRLNGTVPIVPGSASIQNGVLTVKFPACDALQSQGTVVPGSIVFPRVQGGFTTTADESFSGAGPVNGVGALAVLIDIKPGSFPNSINLGSQGVVPVAILSTPTFDARTVDPTSVTLAGATVKMKGKGTPVASFQDVNGDGLLDLVVQVSTQALEISPDDTRALLEGKTFGGTMVSGTDSVRIVP